MTKLEESFELSRNPEDYEASTHLIQRVKDRDSLDFDIITEAIEEGNVVEVNCNSEGDSRHNAVIHHDWLHSTFRVVVGVEDPTVQTAMEIES